MKIFIYLFVCFTIFTSCKDSKQEKDAILGDGERPNILWIRSEDNGTYIGPYGDKIAQTPNLDKLAEQGVRYSNAFANAPVCAVNRSSIILGVPAITTGTHHMRSRYRVPDSLVPYPTLLKEAGYYLTSYGRTDYNNSSFDSEIYDEYGKKAHYRNRPEGKPFFHVFNILSTHEGQIFERHYPEKYPEAQTPAEGIVVPPYQVNTPENIKDWQRVYDRVADMDKKVGEFLADLEESGEAENTIVIYSPDHAGITLRSKRYIYDSGTRVPLIIYFPEKWKHLAPGKPGSVIERLVQMTDIPPTLLSLAGAKVPDYMTGHIFLGPSVEPAPETVLLFSDRFVSAPEMRRGLTDGRWKYIRNYEPDRPRFQMITYPLYHPGQLSQVREYQAGRTTPAQSAFFLPQPPEELYDTQADPHEIENLAGLPEYADKLEDMGQKLNKQLLAARDAGFIPEPMMEAIDKDSSTTIYDFGQSTKQYHLDEIFAVANKAQKKDPSLIPDLVENVKADDPIIRYWSILGLRALGKEAKPALKEIETALEDPEISVRITAMIALGNIGQRSRALELLVKEAKDATTDVQANWALHAIKYLDAPEAIEGFDEKELVKGSDSRRTFLDLAHGGTMYQPAVYDELQY
ncbi:MAG: sulfatase [Muricauda sp.]|nr:MULTISPECIES: sulfatase-like hydrolase/transferase [unclassified Allomuricauda]MAU17009.1 sulfatase [Allomuricauda sp.]|tara:strand:- start:88 stop:1980 length:1893 start_codon:yes stop_codon:yes gene_type:complete